MQDQPKTNRKSPASIVAALTLSAAFAATTYAADKPMGAPWNAPSSASSKKNPVSADKASVRKGKKLYKAACLPCHGARGKGNGAAAVALPIHPGNLTDSKRMKGQSDGAIFWKMSEGRGPMPPFKAAFSDTDRWNILNYIRTLAK
ncbi:MAG: c-type cytochrome [Verrucomicrobiota bacterium]